MLLLKKPTTIAQTIKNATEIDYALNFEKQSEPERAINAISQPNPMDQAKLSEQLQQTLEQMSMHLEALETRLQTDSAHYTLLRTTAMGTEKDMHQGWSN